MLLWFIPIGTLHWRKQVLLSGGKTFSIMAFTVLILESGKQRCERAETSDTGFHCINGILLKPARRTDMTSRASYWIICKPTIIILRKRNKNSTLFLRYKVQFPWGYSETRKQTQTNANKYLDYADARTPKPQMFSRNWHAASNNTGL